MIKGRGSLDDKPLIICGLSEENLERLRAGLPILVALDDLGFTGSLLITYGVTEEALLQELEATFRGPTN